MTGAIIPEQRPTKDDVLPLFALAHVDSKTSVKVHGFHCTRD
jgi:hypothetical protein